MGIYFVNDAGNLDVMSYSTKSVVLNDRSQAISLTDLEH